MTNVLNTNDPLYAYNSYGYTNQNDGNTGTLVANIPNVTGLGTDTNLIEPAALSGYVGRTFDPDVTTAGGGGTTLTLVSQTVYLASLNILGPALVSNVTFFPSASGTQTHFTIGIYNAINGAKLAATADQGATGVGAATTLNTLALATPTVLMSGFYWVALLSVNSTSTSLKTYTLAAEAQTLLTNTTVIPFVQGKTLRWATGTTGLSSLGAGGALPSVLTTAMACTATASGWFAGLS